MGPEAAAAPLFATDIAAAGAPVLAGGMSAGTALQLAALGTNFIAQQQALNRQKKISRAMSDYEVGRARKGRAITEKFIEGETPEAREAARMAAEAEAAAGYERSIGAAGAADRSVSGKGSDRYSMGKVASDTGASAETDRLIKALSVMRSPGAAGAIRGREFGRAASGVGAHQQAARGVSGAYGTDMRNVQPNPLVTALSPAVAGYGQGLNYADALKRYRSVAPAFSTS